MSPRPVTITSYNMHKGMSALNRKVQVNRMADALGALGSDVLFLQEVQDNISTEAAVPTSLMRRITTSSATALIIIAATAKMPSIQNATTATPFSAACR